MKNSWFVKLLSISCVVLLLLSFSGCGQTVTEIIVEEEDSSLTSDAGNVGSSVVAESTDNSSAEPENDSNTEMSDSSKTEAADNSKPEQSCSKEEVSSEDDNDKNGDSDNDSTDLKGATVTVGYYSSDNGDGGKPLPSSPTYKEEVELISEIEKKYNCKIAYRELSGDTWQYYRDWIAAAQAGVKFADIIQMSTGIVYPTHMKNGYLTPLDDYIDAKSTIYNQAAMKQSEYYGKHYITVMSNRMYVPKGLFFNKSVFKAFGADTPDNYVSKNDWNWETFLELAKKTTGTKNGVKYYGYGFRGTEIDDWAKSNGVSMVIKSGDKYEFNMGSSQYLKAIQFVYDLYNTHKVATEPKECTNLWKSGNVAMFIGLPGNGVEYMESLGLNNVGFTYLPIGEDANDYAATVEETTAWAIPSTVKNPAVIAKIMTELTYPYKWRSTLDEQQEKNFGDLTSLNVAIDLGNKASTNMNLMPIYDYIRNNITNSSFGITEQKSPQGFVASVAGAAQSEIDAIWKQ